MHTAQFQLLPHFRAFHFSFILPLAHVPDSLLISYMPQMFSLKNTLSVHPSFQYRRSEQFPRPAVCFVLTCFDGFPMISLSLGRVILECRLLNR